MAAVITLTQPSFVIQRKAGALCDSSDPFSNFDFSPAKGSDELFDALRLAYPGIKSHNERLFKAILEFHDKESAASRNQKSDEQVPVGSEHANDTGASNPYAAVPSAPQAPFGEDTQMATEPSCHRLAMHSMTQAFSLNGNTKPRTKRPMTEEEREDYRLTKRVGACERCRKRKRKCPHRIAEAETVDVKRRRLSPDSDEDQAFTRGSQGVEETKAVVSSSLASPRPTVEGFGPDPLIRLVNNASTECSQACTRSQPTGLPSNPSAAPTIPDVVFRQQNMAFPSPEPEPGHDDPLPYSMSNLAPLAAEDFMQEFPFGLTPGDLVRSNSSPAPQYNIIDFKSILPTSPSWTAALGPEGLPQNLGLFIPSLPPSPGLQSHLSMLQEVLPSSGPTSPLSEQSEKSSNATLGAEAAELRQAQDAGYSPIDEFVNFDNPQKIVEVCDPKTILGSPLPKQADRPIPSTPTEKKPKPCRKDSGPDAQLKNLLRGLEDFCRQMNDSVKIWETIYPEPESSAPAMKGERREMSDRYIMYDRETRRAWLLDDRVVRSLTMLLGVAHLMGSVFSKQPPHD